MEESPTLHRRACPPPRRPHPRSSGPRPRKQARPLSIALGSILAALLCLGTTETLLAQSAPDPGAAPQPPELGWFYAAELSFVLAAGNAESSTIGVGASLRREWERAKFLLEAGGLRTKSSTTRRRAIGTPEDFVLVEEAESRLTAENYRVRTRFDRALSERAFAYAGAGWNRNTFAGFDSRWSFVGGGGVIWTEGERQSFRTDVGATLTLQNDVVREGDGTLTFAGLRFSWDYLRKITANTDFTSALVLDENLDDTEDLRADFQNALTVSISRAVALRTSLQLLFDNLPSLTAVALEDAGGTPTGETVLVPLEKTDALFTVALVVNF